MVEDWVRESLANGTALDALELHYQPVVWLGTGELYGAESFVKWRHPERGVLPTGDWLPHAVTTGEIVECTQSMLPTWIASSRGRDGPIVSLNFCGQQFVDPVLMREVLAIEPSIAAGLAIEIHQLQFMVDRANTVSPEVPWIEVLDLEDQLERLTNHGFSVWLDDFGDGSNDEGIISHGGIDVVKLDRQLLSADAGWLARLVATIHEHSKLALFECVETEAHEQLALDVGADLGQGFRYAPPFVERDWVAKNAGRSVVVDDDEDDEDAGAGE
jgi:EAL domain-containing protein (putative c-di-GMP-specific phosphodiesterase class I)